MRRPYHILLQREFDGQWTMQFGDYDRRTVKAEWDDLRDHDVKARDLKIITVHGSHSQAAIDHAIYLVNKPQQIVKE